MKPTALPAISARRSGEVVGETKPIGARPRASSASAIDGSSLRGRSGHDRPRRAGALQRGGESLGPQGEDDVGVDHRQDRQACGDALAELHDGVEPGPRLEGLRPGGVDLRPVGERVRVRDAELDQIGARIGVGVDDGGRRGQSGNPPIRYGIRAALPSDLRGGERRRDPLDPRLSHRRRAPRARKAPRRDPCRRGPRASRGRGRCPPSRPSPSSQAIAWLLSSAGMIPSSLETSRNARSASRSVTAT